MQRRLSEFYNAQVQASAKILELRDASAEDPVITGLSYDSRRVLPGNIYFALPGIHTDGHRFISQALQAGAVAVVHQEPLAEYLPGIIYLRSEDSRFAMAPLADAYFGSPSKELAVIGVTGTEGKSTTVFLIYQLLQLAGKKAGFLSTVQYRTGEKEEWNPEHQTTPEAPTVQAALESMREYGMDYAVLEASSHGLSPRTNRLGEVAFDVAVMTNVTHEHLEFHGSWDQYRTDKANLFRFLDRVSHEKSLRSASLVAGNGRQSIRIPSFGVANADDPSSAYFSASMERRTYTFSVHGTDADLMVKSIESEGTGNRYDVRSRSTGETIQIKDNLPGAFNAGNVLAALLTVSGLLDRPLTDFIPLVPRLRPVRGRMTVVDKGQPFEVLVDYAHTPSSFETVLPPIRKRTEGRGGRLISLFGSGGERDREKRPRQGRIAADWSDLVILSDEDPRGEDPVELLEEIAAGCPERRRGENLFLIPDRPQAIRRAFSMAKEGDIVILLGKGHENSIIYKDRTLPYDEIAEAEKALAEIGYTGKRE
jgi:UDP-N-acetylmuramoyl-L-alanyl-D-glutamate--2,6-diaminopimelate ligase